MDHVQEQTVRLAEGKFLAWAGGLDTRSELMSLFSLGNEAQGRILCRDNGLPWGTDGRNWCTSW